MIPSCALISELRDRSIVPCERLLKDGLTVVIVEVVGEGVDVGAVVALGDKQ